MKLKNKKTGETGYYLHTHRDYKTGVLKVAVLKDGVPFSEFKPYEPIYDYDSLAELNEEWCDYEEQKGNWTIDPMNENYIDDGRYTAPDELERYEELGLKFNTEEEAELAVRKLKAWKRLKDKGFRFTGINDDEDSQELITQCGILCEADIYHLEKDADFLLIFGGEE